MKILVAAKRVVDANIRVRVKLDYTDVDVEHSKMSLNPFDETAIEEAIRLKEQGIATEVVVLSVGGAKSEDILRTALAMGCDRAILVESTTGYESINIAKIFPFESVSTTSNNTWPSPVSVIEPTIIPASAASLVKSVEK